MSMPARPRTRAVARYMAPVLSSSNPRASASSLAAVDLPEPAYPSMVMIMATLL
ncbi:MAG: hypothetical protein U0871_29225 [Gemmataceae bacterium]